MAKHLLSIFEALGSVSRITFAMQHGGARACAHTPTHPHKVNWNCVVTTDGGSRVWVWLWLGLATASAPRARIHEEERGAGPQKSCSL